MIAGALGGAVAGLPGNIALTAFAGGLTSSAVGNYLKGNMEARPGATLLAAGLSGIVGMLGSAGGSAVVSRFERTSTAMADITFGNTLAFGGLGFLSGLLGGAADEITSKSSNLMDRQLKTGCAELMQLFDLDLDGLIEDNNTGAEHYP